MAHAAASQDEASMALEWHLGDLEGRRLHADLDVAELTEARDGPSSVWPLPCLRALTRAAERRPVRDHPHQVQRDAFAAGSEDLLEVSRSP